MTAQFAHVVAGVWQAREPVLRPAIVVKCSQTFQRQVLKSATVKHSRQSGGSVCRSAALLLAFQYLGLTDTRRRTGLQVSLDHVSAADVLFLLCICRPSVETVLLLAMPNSHLQELTPAGVTSSGFITQSCARSAVTLLSQLAEAVNRELLCEAGDRSVPNSHPPIQIQTGPATDLQSSSGHRLSTRAKSVTWNIFAAGRPL